jgi:hypothetical protein
MPVPKKTKRCRAKLLTTTSWIWGPKSSAGICYHSLLVILFLIEYSLQVRAWMHLYGVQMACCTVEIQELMASVVNPLTYILTSAKLDVTGHRWIDALTSYNFNSMYIPGSSNAYADGLSRLPGLLGKSVSNISTESVKATQYRVCPFFHTIVTLLFKIDVYQVSFWQRWFISCSDRQR